jgi:anaerobic nitric oxide reductase flavorubredoxin
MKELRFKNKKAAAFGCYGWSGEAVEVINGMLEDAGFKIIDQGLKNQWNPDEGAMARAFDFGKKLAAE